ncbi:hypothetical protein EVAR_21018_1 [Eumeta japonica]|uniref:Uncharacterized protein n=1 Tax=Eumeta variegata TaxID=151549 RepID=A0A4C1V126_EUMVA|nr:hypothetical protein EVAR_21018_1 [Eumeta japonica]
MRSDNLKVAEGVAFLPGGVEVESWPQKNPQISFRLSIRVAENWFKRFQSHTFDVKDEPRSGRPFTDNLNAILGKLSKIGIIRTLRLIHLKRAVKSAPAAADGDCGHQQIVCGALNTFGTISPSRHTLNTPRHVSTKRPPDRDNCRIPHLLIAQPLMNPFSRHVKPPTVRHPRSAPLRPLTECELVRVFIKSTFTCFESASCAQRIRVLCARAVRRAVVFACSSDKSAGTPHNAFFITGFFPFFPKSL